MRIDYRRGAFFQRAGSPAGAQAGARTGNVRRQRERRRTGVGRLERNESTRNASGSSDEPPPQRAAPPHAPARRCRGKSVCALLGTPPAHPPRPGKPARLHRRSKGGIAYQRLEVAKRRQVLGGAPGDDSGAVAEAAEGAVDPFWVTAARQLFSNGAGVLWRKDVTENSVLVDHLLKTELTALAEAMEGTVAQSIVDPENPKTALSVRAMLTAHLGALELLPDTGGPFSIREWIGQEDRHGFLFLTSRGDQHASLRGLISTWLEIAVNALLSLEQDDGRRVWVILDELPTLHQVPSLQPGLAESRQFGGCFVLGVQVISALRDLYGRNGAETISGLCGTRVVLAAPDRDTAQWSADSLGRAEVEEVAEGFSYGANTIRDGVSLTPKRELRALALASEIMRLPNLSGYLRFPGPLPVATIELDYVKRPAAAERFVPREDAPVQGALELPTPDEAPETEPPDAPAPDAEADTSVPEARDASAPAETPAAAGTPEPAKGAPGEAPDRQTAPLPDDAPPSPDSPASAETSEPPDTLAHAEAAGAAGNAEPPADAPPDPKADPEAEELRPARPRPGVSI